MVFQTKDGTVEYRPFSLIYMGYKSSSVRSYFFDYEVCQLMHKGEIKKALDRAYKVCQSSVYERIGIETITKRCTYGGQNE